MDFFFKGVINSVSLIPPFSLPQNALPSDDDDKDPNDPHKALDIDLDKWVCAVLILILHMRWPFCSRQLKLTLNGRYIYPTELINH